MPISGRRQVQQQHIQRQPRIDSVAQITFDLFECAQVGKDSLAPEHARMLGDLLLAVYVAACLAAV